MTNDKCQMSNGCAAPRRFIPALLLLFVVAFSSANADSLWKAGTTSSPYSPEKSFKVGDILTVLIVESSNASNKAGTSTNVSDDLSLKFSHSIERLNPLIAPSTSIGGGGGQKYGGSGSTQRGSTVTAKVAAAVTDVMANGNLKIEGRHKVVVNDETQEIFFSGIVRSKDISISNSIYSYQVADAEISIKGTGVVQEADSPGWFIRIFNWLF